jgi:hypothetical protein
MSLPPAIEALTNVLLALPGVESVEAKHTPLEELDVADLGFVPFGDLPHAAILRTKGGLRGEALGQVFVEFRPELESWRTLEFLSWQVRDSSRAGKRIQIRSRGLPPFIGGEIQLGTTLVFIIEFFVDGMDVDPQRLLKEIAEFAGDIQSSLKIYRLSWVGGVVLKE